MANLGNLIVRGVTRILGDAYANKFIGNLQGNADTATSAIKASTADSAANATSANKASIATAVQDYGTSDYREIKIGYNGSGLSSSTITHAVGFTDGGTKIKDISKDEFRNGLATASGTWNISITGNAATATNADTLDGYHASMGISKPWGTIPVITESGWMDVGKHFEFHYDNTTGSDFSTVLKCTGNYSNIVSLPSKSGTLALLTDNVASASKWANARTITLTGSVTGSVSIDGSANVSLATTTNHTHTFTSLASKPTSIDGYGITDGIRLAYYSGNNYVGARSNYGENMTGDKYLEWWNSAGWVHHKAGKYSVPGGTSSQFLKADGSLDSTAYLPLTGGTLSGSRAGLLKLDSSNSSYNAILFKIGGVAKSEFGFTVDKCSYIYDYTSDKYLGVDVGGTPFYGAFSGAGKYTLLHSGNYNSYSPKLDGTGASGTWGINISGNAATATNADKLGNIAANNYFKDRDAIFNSEWSGKYLWTLWDNHLYAADKRLAITLTGTTSTNFSLLFDGSFESAVSITEAKAVLHIKSATEGNVWTEGLPYGDFYVVFYNSDAENITGRVYCNYASQGTGWHDLTVIHVGPHIWKLNNGYYQLSDLEITITKPVSSASIDLCQVLHVVERSPSPYYAAVMSKYCDQKTNYNIEAAKFIKTGGTSSQFLKADGSVDSNTYSKSNHTHSSVLDINDSSTTTFAYSKAGLSYGDYTWLAGWNGYELRAVNKSQFAQASHTHTKSQITDFPTSLPASGGYAYGIESNGILDSQEKIDNFITPSRLEYILFKTTEANNLDFASNDGMLLSIPWNSTAYGVQLAFDDTLTGTIKVRGKSNSWGNWYTLLHSGNYTTYTVKKDGTGASGTWGINITGNAATSSNASAVNGVSFTWDGEITSSQGIAAGESGTSIRTMSAYNTFISMCSYLDEGSSDVTDGTMFITSYATDNGFDDPNGKNKPYKRKASLLGNYINNKCSSIYATTTGVNSNYYTCSESDSRYIQSETDPVGTAAKVNYYTKTESDNKFQPKGTYLTEQNLQGYATQEGVRGEEYLYRSGGTMDARAEIGITTKLFIGNSTSSDTCYTKFNCILHGGGDESNPNGVIRDNGYAEFKSSVSANAFYVSSDIRLKNILDDINIDFDKLKLIPKKYYTWKGSDILQLGTIAQDIQKIYPEVVSKNENGYLSVDYSKLSIIALAAIDKLNERIKELECQIKL